MRLDLKGAKYAVANRSRSVDDFDVEKQIHEMSMNAIDETHEKKMPHAIGRVHSIGENAHTAHTNYSF